MVVAEEEKNQNVTGASLNGIYNRLANAPSYHPLEAETFADWSMEAGDMVTVQRAGNRYYSPVHQSVVTWRKKQNVSVSSGGTQERESLAKLSQQKYNRGSSGYRRTDYWAQVVADETGRLQAGIELTYSSARLWVDNANELMHTELALTASTARLWVDNAKEGLHGEIELTASTAKIWVENAEERMKAGLDVTLSSAKLYAYNRTTKAEIIARINEDGKSEALISADRVSISGRTTIGDCMSVSNGSVRIKKNTYVEGNLMVKSLTVRDGNNEGTISGGNIEGIIVDAKVDGNVLTLTTLKGKKKTFSKATSLSGTWSSGHLTVSAKQGTTTVSTYHQYLGQGGKTGENGNSWYIPITVRDSPYNEAENTGFSVFVNAQPNWQAGFEYGKQQGGNVPYNVSFSNSGTFIGDPNNALNGWHPLQITGVPNKVNQAYRYIRFTVDGKPRSFYFV